MADTHQKQNCIQRVVGLIKIEQANVGQVDLKIGIQQ